MRIRKLAWNNLVSESKYTSLANTHLPKDALDLRDDEEQGGYPHDDRTSDYRFDLCPRPVLWYPH